jgi:hypothetical protein
MGVQPTLDEFDGEEPGSQRARAAHGELITRGSSARGQELLRRFFGRGNRVPLATIVTAFRAGARRWTWGFQPPSNSGRPNTTGLPNRRRSENQTTTANSIVQCRCASSPSPTRQRVRDCI